MPCLRRLMGIKWWHKVTNTEVRCRANTEPLECILAQRQLRWMGHVCRMPEGRLTRQVLCGELAAGGRLMGGQKKRYKDHICATMKRCGIPPAQLEELAGHSETWRNACYQGVEHYVEQYNAAAENRRARRHQKRPAAAVLDYVCAECGRACASRIGLHSHMSGHRRRSDLQAQHHLQLVRREGGHCRELTDYYKQVSIV